MLLPSLKAARDKAKSIVCVSNQKQIGLGFLMYAESSDNLVAYRAESSMAWSQTLIESGLLNNSNVYFCPASGTDIYDQWRTYGMYRSISELSSSPPTAPFLIITSGDDANGNHFYRLDKMENPTEFVLAADCTQSTDAERRGFYYFTWQGFGVERCAIHTLHNGTANCLMVDGHVESSTGQGLSELCQTKTTSNKFIKAYIDRHHVERWTYSW